MKMTAFGAPHSGWGNKGIVAKITRDDVTTIVYGDDSRVVSCGSAHEPHIEVHHPDKVQQLIICDFGKRGDIFTGEVWDEYSPISCNESNGYFGKWIPCDAGYQTEELYKGDRYVFSTKLCERLTEMVAAQSAEFETSN